jgi:hypothetical protein
MSALFQLGLEYYSKCNRLSELKAFMDSIEQQNAVLNHLVVESYDLIEKPDLGSGTPCIPQAAKRMPG